MKEVYKAGAKELHDSAAPGRRRSEWLVAIASEREFSEAEKLAKISIFGPSREVMLASAGSDVDPLPPPKKA